jgi:hypothetical protein
MIPAFLRRILSSALRGNAVTERALRTVEGPILFEDIFDAIDILLVPDIPKLDRSHWPWSVLHHGCGWGECYEVELGRCSFFDP